MIRTYNDLVVGFFFTQLILRLLLDDEISTGTYRILKFDIIISEKYGRRIQIEFSGDIFLDRRGVNFTRFILLYLPELPEILIHRPRL